MKTKLKKSIPIVTLLIFLPFICLAQSYGGSAYVSVIDDDGNVRTINETVSCYKKDIADAKGTLYVGLKNLKYSGEKFNGQVYYSIDKCKENDNHSYGGSASVRVRNEKGDVRTINETISCYKKDIADAKVSLYYGIKNLKYTGEIFISEVIYNIDSCN